MKKRNIIREAGVLLSAFVLLFSATSVFAANTEENTHPVIINDGHGCNKVTPVSSSTGRDVLWNNGDPDGINGLSCIYSQSYSLDREVVDDFEIISGSWSVTGGSFRIVTYLALGSDSVAGVNVFFYEDDGTNKPKMTPFASPTAIFTASNTGAFYFSRPEILIQVTFAAVELTAGKWWVCFQPVIEDNAFWLTAPAIGQSVWIDYPDLGYYRWTKGSSVFSGAEYSVSFTLIGTASQQPKLEITNIKTGFGISALLKNTGDATATNIAWSITAQGGLVFPKIKSDVIPTLAADASATIKMMVLGFGPAVFTISAECDEGAEVESNASGFVFIFFILGT